MGVHYRFDSTEGIILGETFAVRVLHQVRRSQARRPARRTFREALFSAQAWSDRSLLPFPWPCGDDSFLPSFPLPFDRLYHHRVEPHPLSPSLTLSTL